MKVISNMIRYDMFISYMDNIQVSMLIIDRIKINDFLTLFYTRINPIIRLGFFQFGKNPL